MTIERCSSLVLFAVFSFITLAPLRTRADERAEAFQAFQAGLAGDARAAAFALARYQELSKAAPDDPVLLAYAGSAATIVGRDTAEVGEALKITEEGLARVDRAVARLGPAHDAPGPNGMPARLETYLVAAGTYLGVPDEVFHRRGDARAVLSKATAHPAFAHLPPVVRAEFARLEAELARMSR